MGSMEKWKMTFMAPRCLTGCLENETEEMCLVKRNPASGRTVVDKEWNQQIHRGLLPDINKVQKSKVHSKIVEIGGVR